MDSFCTVVPLGSKYLVASKNPWLVHFLDKA